MYHKYILLITGIALILHVTQGSVTLAGHTLIFHYLTINRKLLVSWLENLLDL